MFENRARHYNMHAPATSCACCSVPTIAPHVLRDHRVGAAFPLVIGVADPEFSYREYRNEKGLSVLQRWELPGPRYKPSRCKGPRQIAGWPSRADHEGPDSVDRRKISCLTEKRRLEGITMTTDDLIRALVADFRADRRSTSSLPVGNSALQTESSGALRIENPTMRDLDKLQKEGSSPSERVSSRGR